ncbi:MAG: nuclear transport factor 2 family protein [Myxococcota bacterium]
MGTADTERIAHAWIEAFNAHDVDRLVALYAEDAHHTSPKLRVQKPETLGRIVGRAALHAWWTDAIQRIPSLAYRLSAVTAGERSVFIEYTRHAEGQDPLPVAEVFEIAQGLIVASRVYHG